MVRDSKANPAAHQPSKAELEEDVSIDATPEALAWAVTRGGAEPREETPQKRAGANSMKNSYTVDVFRCEEAGVYVGTSEDIPGLTLEAETRGGLLDAILEMVPQLIEQNIGLPQDGDVHVAVRVRQPLYAKKARRKDQQRPFSPKPRYVFEDEASLSYA